MFIELTRKSQDKKILINLNSVTSIGQVISLKETGSIIYFDEGNDETVSETYDEILTKITGGGGIVI